MKPLKYLYITVIYKSQCNQIDSKDNFVVKTRQKNVFWSQLGVPDI